MRGIVGKADKLRQFALVVMLLCVTALFGDRQATAGWVIQPVDSAGIVGLDTSLAFNVSLYSKPAISYYDSTNGDLKLARDLNGDGDFADANEIITVDSTGEVGSDTSIAFDSTNEPAISYYDLTNANLKFARFVPEICNNGIDDDGDGLVDCNDPECPPCTTTTIPTTTTTIATTTTTIPTTTTTVATTTTTIPTTTTTVATTTTTSTTTTTVPCLCPDDGIPPAGCISGRVTNRVNQPLAGKIVKLKRTFPRRPPVSVNLPTDNDGCYRFSNLEDGTYKVKVKKCKGGGTQTKVITGGGKVNDTDFECK